ncbi:serpin family protein [Methanococcoides burtonii]|uniref:serpin family protein n=1 Tax=Methanococcoides burtonii TaxID=29291 RepID=UPI001E41C788|nr:serpin family protein [Methanococcoides burtonii]
MSTFVLFSVGCVENSIVTEEKIIDIESVEKYDLVAANNAFAFDMYSISKNENEGNVLFSPYSIFSAISICYEGAEGSTKKQIADVFGYPLEKIVLEANSKKLMNELYLEDENNALKTANALWIKKNYLLNEQYVFNVETFYGGLVKPLDFINKPEDSRNTINLWVEEKTSGKINEMVTEGGISPATLMMITNTVYFNGTWYNQFEPRNTKQEQFYLSNGQSKTVDFMTANEVFNCAEDHSAKIVELPYRDNNISMYIVLPKENNISNFESSFTIDKYTELKYNMSKQQGEICLPKFTYSTNSELVTSLQDLGMTDAFNIMTANFSGLYNSEKYQKENLAISGINHKAVIDVNEQGTEAAAATLVSFFMGYSAPNWELKADHPFMFFIEDRNTECILFMGKVENPDYEEVSV